MKLHEYQAKGLLRKFGIITPDSEICSSMLEVKEAIKSIGVPCAIKAQVHAGGRGKAGGIKLAYDTDEALIYAEQLLGMKIITGQTKKIGQIVSKVLIEKAVNIQKELYLAMLIDRDRQKICLIGSLEGGMEIEEVAQKNPSSIFNLHIDYNLGLWPYQLRQFLQQFDLSNSIKTKLISTALGIYQAFVKYDAALIEINPLVITDDHQVIALDAKMIIDDNSLYRQQEIAMMMDPTQEDEKELLAQRYGLSYVSLEGNIGCLVNGAGLAMATMDIIKYAGGEPANFLDVGGSATEEKVEKALAIIAKDLSVKAIFVNVFGGIAKCDVIANGVINAAKSLKLSLPLIVRLKGTNVEQGQTILSNSGLKIFTVEEMLEGARLAVSLASS